MHRGKYCQSGESRCISRAQYRCIWRTSTRVLYSGPMWDMCSGRQCISLVPSLPAGRTLPNEQARIPANKLERDVQPGQFSRNTSAASSWPKPVRLQTREVFPQIGRNTSGTHPSTGCHMTLYKVGRGKNRRRSAWLSGSRPSFQL